MVEKHRETRTVTAGTNLVSLPPLSPTAPIHPHYSQSPHYPYDYSIRLKSICLYNLPTIHAFESPLARAKGLPRSLLALPARPQSIGACTGALLHLATPANYPCNKRSCRKNLYVKIGNKGVRVARNHPVSCSRKQDGTCNTHTHIPYAHMREVPPNGHVLQVATGSGCAG